MHHVFSFGDDFDTHVVAPYVAAHAAGRTPNPCVECNRHLKFDRFLRRAEQLGFDAVATGHHARVVQVDGRWRLRRGADAGVSIGVAEPAPNPDAGEVAPFSSTGLAFDGRGSLLVANVGEPTFGYQPGGIQPPGGVPNYSNSWVVFDSFVNDTASPLVRPVIP